VRPPEAGTAGGEADTGEPVCKGVQNSPSEHQGNGKSSSKIFNDVVTLKRRGYKNSKGRTG